VVLVAPGPDPVPVIRAIREATGVGLADAKRLVDAAPSTVRAGLSRAEADRIAGLLREAGATVRVE
jgi:large subunit ribosomal protein L7/L12